MFGWMEQGKSGLPLHNEEYVCSIGDPQGHLSMLPCPVIKINGQLQPSSGKTTNGSDLSRMKVWVTVPRTMTS